MNLTNCLEIYLGNMRGEGMHEQVTTDSDRLWQRLAKEYSLWAQILKEFFSKEIDPVAILQRAFKKGDIAAALHVMQYMSPDELIALFNELIHVSTSQMVMPVLPDHLFSHYLGVGCYQTLGKLSSLI